MASQTKCDYYQVLGVSPSATQKEIEEAHQTLVAGLRVSEAPEASDRLVDARKAHIVLADPKKRIRYDASLADARASAGVGGGLNPTLAFCSTLS